MGKTEESGESIVTYIVIGLFSGAFIFPLFYGVVKLLQAPNTKGVSRIVNPGTTLTKQESIAPPLLSTGYDLDATEPITVNDFDNKGGTKKRRLIRLTKTNKVNQD